MGSECIEERALRRQPRVPVQSRITTQYPSVVANEAEIASGRFVDLGIEPFEIFRQDGGLDDPVETTVERKSAATDPEERRSAVGALGRKT